MKTILQKLENIEAKSKKIKSELKELKQVVQKLQVIEPDVTKMFNEEYRIKYALKITYGNRLQASLILEMSERTLYRLMYKYRIKI